MYAKNNFELAVRLYFYSNNKKRKNFVYNKKIHPIIKKIVFGYLDKNKKKYNYLSNIDNDTLFMQFSSYFHQYFHNFNSKKGRAFSYITNSFQNFLFHKNVKCEKYAKSRKKKKVYFPEYYCGNPILNKHEESYLEKCEKLFYFNSFIELLEENTNSVNPSEAEFYLFLSRFMKAKRVEDFTIKEFYRFLNESDLSKEQISYYLRKARKLYQSYNKLWHDSELYNDFIMRKNK